MANALTSKDGAGDALAAGGAEPLQAPAQATIDYWYTGDYRIDALLLGTDGWTGESALEYRWNHPAPLGSQVRVTYSFMTAKPTYGSTDSDGAWGFSPFTTQQKAAVREIMAQLQVELGIILEEVADFSFSYGQIRFGNNNQPNSLGYAWLPNSADDNSGDVWLDIGSSEYPVRGSAAWQTLIHEIGHALGLKHPGDYEGAGDGNYLGTLEDNTNYTVMSYIGASGGQYRDWFGMYDLLTLKKLYGNGTLNAGATVHRYDDSAGATLKIIDDVSGNDTLDLSALTLPATVDLRPGGFSSVGSQAFGWPVVNNLSISLDTVIENYVGTATHDWVVGNDANNVFSLGLGTNVADGGAGIDSVLYGASRAGYQVGVSGSTIRITGAGLSDTLTGVERAEFADGKLAFDLAGHAGTTAKVIGAVFGPGAVIQHPDYAGIGLSLLDGGMNYAALVQYALDALLGPHTNGQVVDVLYRNVAGAEPSAAEYSVYLSQLDSGSHTQASLGMFAADHPLNATNIDLIGLAQTGLAYV